MTRSVLMGQKLGVNLTENFLSWQAKKKIKNEHHQ
jgi:hypothetical protein